MDGAGLHAVGLVPATQRKATLAPPLVAARQSTVTPGGGGGASVLGILHLLASRAWSLLEMSSEKLMITKGNISALTSRGQRSG